LHRGSNKALGLIKEFLRIIFEVIQPLRAEQYLQNGLTLQVCFILQVAQDIRNLIVLGIVSMRCIFVFFGRQAASSTLTLAVM
jgi:hypothetical protein